MVKLRSESEAPRKEAKRRGRPPKVGKGKKKWGSSKKASKDENKVTSNTVVDIPEEAVKSSAITSSDLRGEPIVRLVDFRKEGKVAVKPKNLTSQEVSCGNELCVHKVIGVMYTNIGNLDCHIPEGFELQNSDLSASDSSELRPSTSDNGEHRTNTDVEHTSKGSHPDGHIPQEFELQNSEVSASGSFQPNMSSSEESNSNIDNVEKNMQALFGYDLQSEKLVHQMISSGQNGVASVDGCHSGSTSIRTCSNTPDFQFGETNQIDEILQDKEVHQAFNDLLELDLNVEGCEGEGSLHDETPSPGKETYQEQRLSQVREELLTPTLEIKLIETDDKNSQSSKSSPSPLAPGKRKQLLLKHRADSQFKVLGPDDETPSESQSSESSPVLFAPVKRKHLIILSSSEEPSRADSQFKVIGPDDESSPVRIKPSLINLSSSEESCETADLSRPLIDRIRVSSHFVKKVVCIDMEPNIKDLISLDSSDLLKGFCSEGCRRLCNFSNVVWRNYESIAIPYCKRCLHCLGKEKKVRVDFWFRCKVKPTTEENIMEVIFSACYGAKFLGCSKSDYASNKDDRERVHHRLRRIIEERTPFDLSLVHVKTDTSECFRAV